MKARLVAAVSFTIALAAIFTFEYAVAFSTFAGLCGPAGPYSSVAYCPRPSGVLIAAIPFSFPVAVIGGLVTAVTLGVRWALVLWAALMVPLGIGCVLLARAFTHVSFIMYAVALLLVVMGAWPLVSSSKATESA